MDIRFLRTGDKIVERVVQFRDTESVLRAAKGNKRRESYRRGDGENPDDPVPGGAHSQERKKIRRNNPRLRE